MAVDFPYIVLT